MNLDLLISRYLLVHQGLRYRNAWGVREPDLVTSDAWKEQKKISAEEGLVAIAYERKFGPYDRVFQTAKLMIYAPASGLYSCPLAMTDGATKTLLSLPNQSLPEVENAIKRLTSRDPSRFWTSGQWYIKFLELDFYFI